MSEIVTARFKADPAKFKEVAQSHADTLKKIVDEAKTKGCVHHCFVEADGDVVVVDEWDSVESFQTFFASNPDIPGILQEVGVAGAPEVKSWEKIDTPDEF